MIKTNVQDLELSKIKPSVMNTRVIQNDEALKELTASIKEKGVITPVIVRKVLGDYELLAGSRRYTASLKAGLKTIPAKIIVADNTEALEIILTENLQREDVHPYDEAVGFHKLQKIHKDAKEIADIVGKNISFVVKRVQLVNLNERFTELFKQGEIYIGAAQMICALSDRDQGIVSKWMDEEKYRWPLDMSDIGKFIRGNIMMKLSDTIFDVEDKTLNKKMGSCIGCPYNTETNTMIFDIITDESRCTLEKCFTGKTREHMKRTRQVLVDKHGEKGVIDISLSNYDIPGGMLPSDKYNSLSSDHYDVKDRKKQCDHIRIGFIVHTQSYSIEELGKSLKICVGNKSCKTHYDGGSDYSVAREAIPEDETLIKGTERKMKKRRAKQKKTDIKLARADLLFAISKNRTKELNDFELDLLCEGVWYRYESGQMDMAVLLGVVKEENCDYPHGRYGSSWENKFISIKKDLNTRQEKFAFIRGMMAGHVLDNHADDPTMAPKNVLIAHGKSLGIEVAPKFRRHQDLRIEKYTQENEALQKIKDNHSVKEDAAREMVRQLTDANIAKYAKVYYEDFEPFIGTANQGALLKVIGKDKEKQTNLIKFAKKLNLSVGKNPVMKDLADSVFDRIKELKNLAKAKKK